MRAALYAASPVTPTLCAGGEGESFEWYEGLVKVLCPHCDRLIALEVFRVEGASLIINCAKCGAESRVESAPAAVNQVATHGRAASLPPRVSLASTEGSSNVVVLRTAGHEATQKAARAADEGPFTIPDDACPKCIGLRAPTPSCPYCGILFDTFDEATVLPPKWLREDWVEVLRDWGNELKHGQLRRKAQQTDDLATLGRLYRLRQAVVPEDPVAAEGRAEVLRLATVAMSFRPPSTEGELEVRRRKVLLWGGFLLVFITVVLGLIQLLSAA